MHRPKANCAFPAAAALLLLGILIQSPFVKAGLTPKCLLPDYWAQNNNKLKEAVNRDLSTCQLKVVNDKKKDLNLKGNDNLVGGKGSADVVGIPAGGKSEGCSSGDECMATCQALCCLMEDCLYAEIKRETKTTDYVVYKETATYFYCRTKKGSSATKNHDDIGFCAKATDQASYSCPQLAAEVLGLNQNEVKSLISLQNNNTCSTSRRLLKSSFGTVGYSKAELEAELDRKLFSKFAKLKEKIVGFMGKAGSCSNAKKKLKNRISESSCPSGVF